VFTWGPRVSTLGAAVRVDWRRAIRYDFGQIVEVGWFVSETEGLDDTFDSLLIDLHTQHQTVDNVARAQMQCQIIERLTDGIRAHSPDQQGLLYSMPISVNG